MKKKTFARIGAVVLSVMLLIVLMPAAAFATDEAAEKWDGTVDTAWFTGTETEYNIDSAAALAGVSQLAAEKNTFQGITLNLTTDVDLDGLPWTPIANFRGTFNGNHHKVSNMYVELVQGQSGFFEYLFQATVENLTIDQANVVMTATNSGFYQGVLAGWAQSSTVQNCGASGKLTADISGSYVPCIGGFIGSVFRYLIGLSPVLRQGALPLQTLLVNVVGAIFIGMILKWTQSGVVVNEQLTLFLRIGICGGFTTFSTFSQETAAMIQEGRWLPAFSYALLSVGLCVLGVFLGQWTAGKFSS